MCQASSFEGATPLDSTPKDCYCDWKNSYLQPKAIQANKQLWRAQLAEKAATEKILKA